MCAYKHNSGTRQHPGANAPDGMLTEAVYTDGVLTGIINYSNNTITNYQDGHPVTQTRSDGTVVLTYNYNSNGTLVSTQGPSSQGGGTNGTGGDSNFYGDLTTYDAMGDEVNTTHYLPNGQTEVTTYTYAQDSNGCNTGPLLTATSNSPLNGKSVTTYHYTNGAMDSATTVGTDGTSVTTYKDGMMTGTTHTNTSGIQDYSVSYIYNTSTRQLSSSTTTMDDSSGKPNGTSTVTTYDKFGDKTLDTTTDSTGGVSSVAYQYSSAGVLLYTCSWSGPASSPTSTPVYTICINGDTANNANTCSLSQLQAIIGNDSAMAPVTIGPDVTAPTTTPTTTPSGSGNTGSGTSNNSDPTVKKPTITKPAVTGPESSDGAKTAPEF